MKIKSFTRRDFFKVMGAFAFTSGLALPGCDSKNSSEGRDGEINEQIDGWTKTGNKNIKKAYTHIIWDIKNFEERKHYSTGDVTNNNGEIIVPDGYVLVSSEPMTKLWGDGSKTQGIKYNYVNAVDVEVEEYVNDETQDVSFPFAGTPLEKVDDMPKVLIKTE